MMETKKKKTRPVTTQIEVPCPKWLQKAILKNLKKASTNKLWPDRAKKAIEILKTISAQHNAPEAAVNIKPSTAAPLTQTDSSSGRILTSDLCARNPIQHTLCGISSCLKTFVKKLAGLRIGAGGVFSDIRDEKYRIDAS